MRNEAPVIVLAEWAARVNAETRACMGHSVAPEIPERQQARAYLAGLMTDEEAAACVAADLAAANAARADDEYDGLPSTFAAACRKADAKQHRKPPDPTIERAHRLMADEVTLERVWHEFNKPAGVAASTLQAAEFLLQQKDPARLGAWLDRHSAEQREAILRHFEQRKRMQPA